MSTGSEREKTAKATELMQSIRSQLDGSKLPKLSELEGTEIKIRVVDGKLNWHGTASLGPLPCW